MGFFSSDKEINNIILTTTHTIPNKEIVKIISLIHAHGVTLNLLQQHLKKEAMKLKADAIVGIGITAGNVAYGRAVKLKDID